MRVGHLPILLVTVVAFGCTDGAVAPTPGTTGLALQPLAAGVAHRATVGGPDVCGGTGGSPGCDANLSLIALQFSDGSASGQWHDQFSQANGGGGIHVIVNCLAVAGNDAWVSGVGPEHAFGNEWVTRVRDLGTTANDPADQLSFTLRVGQPNPRLSGGVRQNCSAMQDLVVFDAPQGQVVVR